jgi:hypothetical protein
VADILDIQTVGKLLIIKTDTSPITGGGTDAPIGSLCLCEDGSGTFTKIGLGLQDWTGLSDIPLWAENKQYVQVTNFDTGSLPVGWSASVSGTGSSVVYNQKTESGTSPGMAFATIGTLAAARVSLITGSGYQYMPSLIDGPETTYFIQMRWNVIPSLTNCAQVLGWINSTSSLTPSGMGNTLAIMYDPANVSGFNPGLITNLFLLARANYNGPTANTVVDLGVTFDTNWRFYKITYDNILNEVRVYRDNVLLTTLLDMANVPGGIIRGVIPTSATGGLGAGFYISNGGVSGGTGVSIRVSKISVFKIFT